MHKNIPAINELPATLKGQPGVQLVFRGTQFPRTLRDAENQPRAIVNAWAKGAAAVSWVPHSTWVLGAADLAMIAAVAEAFEVKHYNKEAIVGVTLACTTGRVLAKLLSFCPLLWVVKAAIAAAATKAMGEGVIAYFRQRSLLPTPVH